MGDFEQLIMLAVLHAGRNAYGARIWKEIQDRGGRSSSMGAVYTTLARLEEKGYLSSRVGEVDPERGGRPRRYYEVESPGGAALREALAATDRMRRGLDLGLAGPEWAGGTA